MEECARRYDVAGRRSRNIPQYLEKESHYENGGTALLRFRSAVLPELVDAVAG
jgi:hypothetical protein